LKRYRVLADYLGMLLVLGLLIGFFGVTTSGFLTVSTFTTIANQIPDAIIIAVGMTFVLIIAGIDLSVGSILALGGAVLGVCLVKLGWPLPLAIAACVGTGFICGAINGLIVIKWSIPSFIVTLGMMEMARGGAYLVTDSQTQYIGGPIEVIAETSIAGLSLPFYIAIAVVVVAQVVLSGTLFGRHMLAIGANEEAARLSGLRTRYIKWAVFAISGGLSALAAVIQTARMTSADPNMGLGSELQAIAAVVIGGTSLMGGRGSVVSTFFGVLIISVLGYGLAQMGAQDPTKRLVTGAVIVIAVVIDYYRHRLGRENWE
jgi:ribose transport system permease protein